MSRGKFVPKVPTLKQQKVKHRLVRPTDRLKSFAAGQQDCEVQFKLTNYQNHIMKISLTPLQILAPSRKNPTSYLLCRQSRDTASLFQNTTTILSYGTKSKTYNVMLLQISCATYRKSGYTSLAYISFEPGILLPSCSQY